MSAEGWEKIGGEYRKVIGHRLAAGTEWPVELVVTQSRRRKWVRYQLCNGTADTRSREFETLAEALSAE